MGEVITLRDERQHPSFEQQKQALEEFLRSIKQAQEKDTLAVSFPFQVKQLREHFVVIPTRQKKPLVRFQTEEQKERANKTKIDTEACLIQPNWLAVVDIDDVEEFCACYGLDRQQLEKIATVKTGKGYHIYLFDPAAKLRSRPLRKGWELRKGENLLVVLPGSRMFHPKLEKNVEYEVLQPKVHNLDDVPEWLQQVLAEEESEQEREEQGERGSLATSVETGEVEVDWDRLLQLALEYYTEGHRQDFVFFLSGWLRKKGVTEEEIRQFVERFLHAVGDDEPKKRWDAVKYTYAKQDIPGLKGWDGLKNILPPEALQDLESCIRTQSGWPSFGGPFFAHKGLLFRVSKKGNASVIGPAIRIVSVIKGESGIAYEIAYGNRRFVVEKVHDMETIQRQTGVPVCSEKNYKEWLSIYVATQAKRIPKRLVCKRTGWQRIDNNRLVFLHPARQPEYIWDEHVLHQKGLAKVNKPELLHELAKEVLGKPSALTLLLVAAYTGVVLSLLPFEAQPFCILVTGPSGVGKTTACQVVVNPFYDAASMPFTAFTTHTGLERLKYQLRDLPLLLDELAVSKVDAESIVFQAATGATKLRSNRRLTINFDDLNNVIFLTSEVAEEEEFRRAGAWRRMLLVPLHERIAIPHFPEVLKSTGAGLDFLNWLEESVNLEALQDESAKVDGLLDGLQPIWKIAKPLVVTLLLLAKFYETDPTPALEYLLRFMRKQVENFSHKADVVERFKEEFTGWVASNSFAFVGLVPESQLARNKLLGKVDDENIYVLTKEFKAFCRETGIDTKALLETLKRQGLLVSDSGGARKMVRILGVSCSCYAFPRSLLS